MLESCVEFLAHVQNGNANGLAADVSAKSAVECGAARKSVIVDTKADAKSLNESFEEGVSSSFSFGKVGSQYVPCGNHTEKMRLCGIPVCLVW